MVLSFLFGHKVKEESRQKQEHTFSSTYLLINVKEDEK